jgi:signal transduction histidine kinase
MATLSKKSLTYFGFSLALILLFALFYVTYNRTAQFLESARWVDHTYRVIIQINAVMSELKNAETAQRGYLLTGNEEFLILYRPAVANVPEQIKRLKQLTGDNQVQYDSIVKVEGLINSRLGQLKESIERRDLEDISSDKNSFIEALEEGKSVMDEIRTQIRDLSFNEEQLLAQRARIVEMEASSTRSWILFGNLAIFALLLSSFAIITREVKKRIEAQSSAEKVALQLEVTNKELESFSYSVSHDLRSPLRAIDGYSRIFEEDYSSILDSEGLRLLGVVRANSKKMGRLIDDLLSFARSGRKDLVAEEIDMHGLVDEAWSEVQVDNQNPQLQFNNNVQSVVLGDRALIKQVLINLLSNAVKYSGPKEKPIVEIDSQVEGGEVVHRVKDNGVGFDMTYAHKLFGVFQRLHTTDEFPGTGVGLAIVQRIIVRHGGFVKAEGQLGTGGTFSFSLPLGR